MISKVEAIKKLKNAGYQVGDNHSVVTIMVPHNKMKKTTIGEIKEVLQKMDYDASFSVVSFVDDENTFWDEEDDVSQVEEVKSLLSEDEDGQFSLASFGLED